MTADVLSARALGRATLARQMLLERQGIDAVTAVARLVGLQAQEPVDPYHALWSRLAGFDPDVLSALIVDRALVRIHDGEQRGRGEGGVEGVTSGGDGGATGVHGGRVRGGKSDGHVTLLGGRSR